MASSIKEIAFYVEEEVAEEITILNFSTYDVGQCDILRLSYNIMGNTVFTVKIFPNGNCDLNKGYTSIELWDTPRNLIFKCVASIIDAEGKSRYLQSFTNETSDPILGLERFVERCSLLNNNSEYLPDDKLTIRLEINLIISSEEGLVMEKPSENARKIKIKDLNDEMESYNFQIETKDGKTESLVFEKGESIMRSPLCKKSLVFRRMLSTAMREKENNKVIITDMGYNTLMNLLSFVRNDSIMLNSVQEIVDLYEAGDKYEVLDLKYECARDLIRNLTVQNVSNVLLLADMHSDKALKFSCILYLQENLEEVFETESWNSLMENWPSLANEAINLNLTEKIEKIRNFGKKHNEQSSSSETIDPDEVFQFYS